MTTSPSSSRSDPPLKWSSSRCVVMSRLPSSIGTWWAWAMVRPRASASVQEKSSTSLMTVERAVRIMV